MCQISWHVVFYPGTVFMLYWFRWAVAHAVVFDRSGFVFENIVGMWWQKPGQAGAAREILLDLFLVLGQCGSGVQGP